MTLYRHVVIRLMKATFPLSLFSLFGCSRSHVFWKDKPLDGADVNAFRVLGLEYATDGKRVYFRANPVKNADPATFQPYEHSLGDADAKDAKTKYLKGIRVGAN